MKKLGGQAIIEGVMIKSNNAIAMAARSPDGRIVSRKMKYISLTEKHKILAFPFLRGVIQLYEMIIAGFNALSWSARQQGEEDAGNWEMFGALVFAILLTVTLFILLPYYASKLFFPPDAPLFGLIDGFFRLLVFLAYLVGIGFMQDVKRMFQYHGAEHMAVHCYESKKELKAGNVKKFPPEHPRCGTSLLLFVVAVSIVLFSLIRTSIWYYNIPARILLIPVVASVSYELLKASSKYNWLGWLSYPGLWVQKLTTKKPNTGQIEVAIAAVNKAK